MKRNYVTPAIKAANIVISQILAASDKPSSDTDPKDDQFFPFNPERKDEDVAE